MKKLLFFTVPLILLAVNLPVVRALSISNRKNHSERIYTVKAVKDGFSVNYTHSVNKGRVHDFYRILDSGELELYKTRFVSYGAGIPEPYESEGAEFFVTEDGYIIENLGRKLPSLVMAVGVIAEHSVTVGDTEFFLKDFFEPQTSLVFEVKRLSILKIISTRSPIDGY
ncbi:DUF1850 domain-containing protein [Treponema sp. C6A8]|uniref:DUF1850 domain-containing protein n=1 Tax=Treponema sp. C6A8 TaxID=1410609 RepID=UPI000571AB33|nr:DUF1850 domain-containing protein [Treponema sp. C6A8]